MASDGSPGLIPGVSVVQGSQTSTSTSLSRGIVLPSNGNAQPAATLPSKATAGQSPAAPDPAALVRNLNKLLNDSGRPDQFRLDPSSGGKLIQQINPSSGEVIGEFSTTEFPALARSVGLVGVLVDSLA